MTKDELVALLLEDDEERFFTDSEKDALSWFLYLREYGCEGYSNWDEESLYQECLDREIIEREGEEL